MKYIFLFTLFSISLAAINKKALEIHIFNVGQADSQLIVFPSGYSILIDCGDRKSDATHTKHVAKRIEAILGKKKVDVFVLTHFHTDHSGKRDKSGIWYLMEKKGFTFGKFIHRNIGTYTGSKLSNCNKDTISWKYVGTMDSSMAKFVCYATSSKEKTKLSKIAVVAKKCSTTQIDPPDTGASVTIVMTDALGVKSSETGKAVARNSINASTKVQENDFSICMRIVYGKFVYATCGDLSGINYKKTGSKFHDIETSTAPMLGEVDLYNVNHHGSDTSTNTKWTNTLKPTVAVVSCGDDLSLPNSASMKHLKNIGAKIYTTGNDCHKSTINKVGGITEMGDDVVVTVPTNGKTFTVASPSGKHKKTFNIKTNKKAATKCK